jgi:hypothetical protein
MENAEYTVHPTNTLKTGGNIMCKEIIVVRRGVTKRNLEGFKQIYCGVPSGVSTTEELRQYIWAKFKEHGKVYRDWRKLVSANEKIAITFNGKDKEFANVSKRAMAWLIANPNF